MGFRFRKSIKIIPGVRVNISKSGVSTSIGTRGATVNIGKRGTRATVGIPGAGISYSGKLSDSNASEPRESSKPDLTAVLIILAVVLLLGLWFALH